MSKTIEEIELAENQIREIQVDYNYRLADFSIGELLKKFVKKGEEANFEDAVFGDLIAFREFLLGSSAFQTLRSRIQNFVLPKPSRRTGREVAVDGDVMEVHLELDDTRCGGIKTARILGSIMRTFDALLIATGHLEPPLEPAMVRLRWKCVSLHNALHTHRSLHDLTVNRGAEKTLQVT